jgi:hypothetical protein
MEQQVRLELDEDLYFVRVLDSLYSEVKNMIVDEVNEKNMLNIVVLLMQLVEKQQQFYGKGKKRLVILLLDKLIDDTVEKEEAAHLKFLTSAIVPSVIDTIVSIDKKELQIKIKETLSSCWCF